MYANLLVRTPNGKEVYAYKVETNAADGWIDVYLDANDGDGSYYIEAGKLRFHPNTRLEITASF